MSGSGRDAAHDDQRNAAAKNGQALVAPWHSKGLLPVRRLAWIWLLLPERLATGPLRKHPDRCMTASQGLGCRLH